MNLWITFRRIVSEADLRWAAADYLGHASIQTTNRIYNHNRVTARDVRDLYRGE